MAGENYTNVLLEDINGKFDQLIEVVSGMREEMKTLAKQTDLNDVKSDVKVIKAAVTDLSGNVLDLEGRTELLELRRS